MSQILTTTDLENYIGSSVDTARAALIVESVNQYIETETKRCWGETKTVTEDYDFAQRIWLKHQDVTEISTVTLGYPQQTQQTYDSSSYTWTKLGRLNLWSGSSNTDLSDYVHVTYTYGEEDVPTDLQEAALGVAVGLYNWAANGGKEVVSSSVGSYRIETIGSIRAGGNSSPTPYNNAAEHHFLVIQSYKTRRV